jgi:hypothetical protein
MLKQSELKQLIQEHGASKWKNLDLKLGIIICVTKLFSVLDLWHYSGVFILAPSEAWYPELLSY